MIWACRLGYPGKWDESPMEISPKTCKISNVKPNHQRQTRRKAVTQSHGPTALVEKSAPRQPGCWKGRRRQAGLLPSEQAFTILKPFPAAIPLAAIVLQTVLYRRRTRRHPPPAGSSRPWASMDIGPEPPSQFHPGPGRPAERIRPGGRVVLLPGPGRHPPPPPKDHQASGRPGPP